MQDGNLKAPSQVFKWFEKMKQNYDKNILAIMQRFEQNNNLHQSRLDEAHLSHIKVMQESHAKQIAQFTSQITQQRQDIDYFKQQFAQQQQTISQLNNRYDTVMVEFIASKQPTAPFREIFDDSYFISTAESPTEQASYTRATVKNDTNNTVALNHGAENQSTENETPLRESGDEHDIENIYQAALKMRGTNNNQQAFNRFKQAATLGHDLAMAAVGRAYFLAEGTDENPIQGLAWLINAAELGLPQAIKRVEYFKVSEPALYQEATIVANDIANELLPTLTAAN